MHSAPVRGPRCWLLNFRNQMMLPSRLSPQIAHEPRDLKPTLNVVTLEIGLAQYCFYGLSACATHFEGRKRSDSGGIAVHDGSGGRSGRRSHKSPPPPHRASTAVELAKVPGLAEGGGNSTLSTVRAPSPGEGRSCIRCQVQRLSDHEKIIDREVRLLVELGDLDHRFFARAVDVVIQRRLRLVVDEVVVLIARLCAELEERLAEFAR